MYFPAWYLGRHPDHNVIMASYEAGQAQYWGDRARDTLQEFGADIFGVTVHPKRNKSSDWRLLGGQGRMRVTGVAGGITGRGFDLAIIDDPIKDAAMANSEIYRARIWDWYTSTLRTRLEPGAIVIVIQTRWHQEDLIGRLRRQAELGGEQWDSLTLPAIYEGPTPGNEQPDPLGRLVGEALWPARYDVEALEKIRATLPGHWWNALFQQRPTPPGGALAQTVWFPVVATMPAGEVRRVRFWDIGGGPKKKPSSDPDWTVGAKVAYHFRDQRFYIEDIKRIRMSAGERDRFILAVAMQDGVETLIREEQEGGSSGAAVIEARKRTLAGFNYRGSKPLGKPIGWEPMLIQAEVGNVRMLYGKWNEGFLAEVADAPYGRHDDQLDAVAGAFHWLSIGDRLAASDVLGIGNPNEDLQASVARKIF